MFFIKKDRPEVIGAVKIKKNEESKKYGVNEGSKTSTILYQKICVKKRENCRDENDKVPICFSVFALNCPKCLFFAKE